MYMKLLMLRLCYITYRLICITGWYIFLLFSWYGVVKQAGVDVCIIFNFYEKKFLTENSILEPIS